MVKCSEPHRKKKDNVISSDFPPSEIIEDWSEAMAG